ncbi:MAG TPA: DUF2934 domain-containing protein [Stellaceae bacterium]|jgi:hypothetical protein
MQSDRENRIKERAHAIWERAGRPHGQHDRHWAQAEAEIADEDRNAKTAGEEGRSIVKTVIETAASVAGAALQAATEAVTGKRTEEADAKKPRAGTAATTGAEGEGDKDAKAAPPKPAARAKTAKPAAAEKTSGGAEKGRGRAKKETDAANGSEKPKPRGRKGTTQASA